ncbi:MAG: hypothetical protein JRI72_06725 [Deltaproteobacteria bacterium]|nr:hypothetical protein [Deltaproteobacteria bacterium]
MLETIILTVFSNLIAISVSVLIFLIIYKKKYGKIESETVEQDINDIFSNISDEVSKKLTESFNSEETQVALTQTTMNAIATLLDQEENQKAISEFITESVKAVVEEILPQMQTQLTGLPPASPEELKNAEKKATQALGALTVNAASELLPPGVGLVLDRVFPEWKEQAQSNPREFMILLRKAQEFGLFNMFSSVLGGQSQGSVSTPSSSSGW